MGNMYIKIKQNKNQIMEEEIMDSKEVKEIKKHINNVALTVVAVFMMISGLLSWVTVMYLSEYLLYISNKLDAHTPDGFIVIIIGTVILVGGIILLIKCISYLVKTTYNDEE